MFHDPSGSRHRLRDQPAIRQNMRIQAALSDAAIEELSVTRRDVVAEIKTAYYRYLQSERAVEILEAARELVAENLRVSQKLFDNGKATADVVYRAEAEVSTVEQQLAKAETDRNLAASAFNLTLNRPLDDPIVQESAEVLLEEVQAGEEVAFHAVGGSEAAPTRERQQPQGRVVTGPHPFEEMQFMIIFMIGGVLFAALLVATRMIPWSTFSS